jgi:RNA polymerase sigma-70 factor, ECF subfamily
MGQLEALLERCRAGDEEAIEELVRRWERKLFYYARRLVANEADAWDVLQLTWVRVVKGIRNVRDSQKLVPWLYRVTRNTTISHRASLLAQERWVDRAAPVGELSAGEAEEAQWTAEDVHWGLGAISVHHRDALTLFFLDDLSIEEIAGVMGVSEGTVKSRLHYGKKSLKVILEKMRSPS